MHELAAFLEKSGTTPAQAARDLGISKGYMADILKGRRTPRYWLMVRLRDWSEGAITLESWTGAKCA